MIEFQSSFVEKLPGDTEFDNYPRQVINSCYSFALPKPVENPSLVAFSEDCARLIDIEPESCEDSAFVQIMSGNYIFGKLSIALQNNGIMGGNIDIALSTFNKGKGSKSLRQKISNKLQYHILQLFEKVNIPLFSIGDLWITDLISLTILRIHRY